MQFILCACVIVYVSIVNVKCASLAKQKIQLAEYTNTDSDSSYKGLDAEVFKIPRTLRPGDKIEVKGLMKAERESMTINLVSGTEGSPDYGNVVCQVKLDFPGGNNTKDAIFINSIKDGELTENDEMIPASGVFLSEQFTVLFKMNKSAIIIDLHAAQASNECIVEDYEDIKFLTIGGDVQKIQGLNFLLS